MLNLSNISQHGLDLNANVTYAVSITVKTKSLSNQLKIFSYFHVSPLLRNALSASLLLILLLILLLLFLLLLLLSLLLFNSDLIRFTTVYYFFIFVNFKLIFCE